MVSAVRHSKLITSLLFLVLLLSGCSSLYFYPQKPWVQNPANQALDYEDIILIHPDGLRLHGWWLPARGQSRGTIYYLHGNAENISTHLNSVKWLPNKGYNVFLLDYRGFGLSEGKPDLEGVLADIELGMDWLIHSGRLNDKPLIGYGQSIGAAMSIEAATHHEKHQPLACLMLEASFDSYRGIARTIMQRSWLLRPWQWLVTPFLPGAEHDPVNQIGRLKNPPKLIMHSPDDPIIPYAHGWALYSAAQPPKQFLTTKGGHTQGPMSAQTRQDMLQFMQESCLPTDER